MSRSACTHGQRASGSQHRKQVAQNWRPQGGAKEQTRAQAGGKGGQEARQRTVSKADSEDSGPRVFLPFSSTRRTGARGQSPPSCVEKSCSGTYIRLYPYCFVNLEYYTTTKRYYTTPKRYYTARHDTTRHNTTRHDTTQ